MIRALVHALVTFVVALLLAEGMLRLIGISGAQERLEIYQFDPEIGWKTRPGTRYYRSSPHYSHFTYYDPDGFPTTEERWDQRLVPGAPTFAFIGDSMTEGYYVPYEQSITEQVDRALPDLQVLNLGVSGYAPDQYLIASRRHLPHFDVEKIAVIFYPANDTVDVERDRYLDYAKPIFGEGLEAPLNVPLERLEPEGASPSARSLLTSTAVWTMFRPFYKRFIAPPPEYEASRDRLRYAEEGMAKSVRLMARISRENPEAGFQVYYVPRREELLERDLHDRNVALFRSECTRHSIQCVVPDFLTGAEDPDVFYLVGDGHLNADGARELARTVLSTPID